MDGSRTEPASDASRRRRLVPQPLLAVLSALVLILAFLLLREGVAPFTTHFYEFAWWSLIGILDGLIWWRSGRSLLREAPRAFAVLALWSVAFWFLFEIVNLRLENWYYICVTPDAWGRWLGSFIAFATVLPAVYLSSVLVHVVLGKERDRDVRRRAPWWVWITWAALGTLSLILPLVSPRYFYPLVWGFLFFLLEPLNYRLGAASLVREWERGSYRALASYLAGGLICGLLWESLNYGARVKWIYTVPFFEELKLFEMPVAGFLGFPPFAVECFVVVAMLRHFGLLPALPGERAVTPEGGPRRGWVLPAGTATVAAVIAAVIALPGMDRHTFASVYPAGPALARSLKPLGYAELAGSADAFEHLDRLRNRDRDGAPADLEEFLELVTLKGIGPDKALALHGIGVRSLRDLADRDDADLYQALRPQLELERLTRAEIRVWLRAARKATRQDP